MTAPAPATTPQPDQRTPKPTSNVTQADVERAWNAHQQSAAAIRRLLQTLIQHVEALDAGFQELSDQFIAFHPPNGAHANAKPAQPITTTPPALRFPDAPATDRQIEFLDSLFRQTNIAAPPTHEVREWTRAEAAAQIERLLRWKNGPDPQAKEDTSLAAEDDTVAA